MFLTCTRNSVLSKTKTYDIEDKSIIENHFTKKNQQEHKSCYITSLKVSLLIKLRYQHLCLFHLWKLHHNQQLNYRY